MVDVTFSYQCLIIIFDLFDLIYLFTKLMIEIKVINMCTTFNIIYFEFCLLAFFYNVKLKKKEEKNTKKGEKIVRLFYLYVTLFSL